MDYKQFEGHTPGPWTEYVLENGRSEISGNAETGRSNWIAWVNPIALDGGIEYNANANIELVKAAPELLAENARLREALEKILKRIEHMSAPTCSSADIESIARAALKTEV